MLLYGRYVLSIFMLWLYLRSGQDFWIYSTMCPRILAQSYKANSKSGRDFLDVYEGNSEFIWGVFLGHTRKLYYLVDLYCTLYQVAGCSVMWIRIDCIRIKINKITKFISTHFSKEKKIIFKFFKPWKLATFLVSVLKK